MTNDSVATAETARILYVSDLDGTLLGPGAVLSPVARATVNALTHTGVPFSYATARSYVSVASEVTLGITAR